jgi:hypothetical protein
MHPKNHPLTSCAVVKGALIEYSRQSALAGAPAETLCSPRYLERAFAALVRGTEVGRKPQVAGLNPRCGKL